MRDDPEAMAGWPDPNAGTKLARIPTFEEWITEIDRAELHETIRRAIKQWLIRPTATFFSEYGQIQVAAEELADAVTAAIFEPPDLPQIYAELDVVRERTPGHPGPA